MATDQPVFKIDDLALRIRESEARRREEERKSEEARLRPPAAHACVVCGGELVPTVETEPFTMHTVIGSRARRWHSGYVCERCHLVYSAAARASTEDREGGEE